MASEKKAWIRIGTRGSNLALAQTEEVRKALIAKEPALAESGRIQIIVIRTSGDSLHFHPSALKGKDSFTKEIEAALLDHTIDIAVHSMKDIPSILPDELTIDCVLSRQDPRDVWFSRSGFHLDTLPSRSRVGTSSVRRQAQILARRTDLTLVPLRGNVDTRLTLLRQDKVDAIIIALAGIRRLKLSHPPQMILDPTVMLPAVGQGALAIERRCNDKQMAAFSDAITCVKTKACIMAERTFLGMLEGSCHMPIAGLATVNDADHSLSLRGLVLSADGQQRFSVEHRGVITKPERLGQTVAETMKTMLPSGFSLKGDRV